MAKTQFGKFTDLLDVTVSELQPILVHLRSIVLKCHPEATEVTRLGDRATTFGVGPKKNIHGYTYVIPHVKWINLGFFQGSSLIDPDKVLQGTGAKMRHIKVKTLGEAKNPVLIDLLKQARKERESSLVD